MNIVNFSHYFLLLPDRKDRRQTNLITMQKNIIVVNSVSPGDILVPR